MLNVNVDNVTFKILQGVVDYSLGKRRYDYYLKYKIYWNSKVHEKKRKQINDIITKFVSLVKSKETKNIVVLKNGNEEALFPANIQGIVDMFNKFNTIVIEDLYPDGFSGFYYHINYRKYDYYRIIVE